ncbi:MAG: coproporphyrinogen-III oxidase family protein [Cyanobacteria bacterium]|nr:coproporphyrinogen-III oxidase family protein [Cyanobacteriota bacterium]
MHIPFCHRRCFYCDFAVVPLGDHADGSTSGSITAYLELLHGEIASAPAGPPLSTVYVGGGTPSMLTPAQVETLLAALGARFGLAAGAEISLELDPASFDGARLAGYLAAGVNRVSLGGQSFDDGVLERLGRRHRRHDLLEAARWLQQVHQEGALASWSLDLIQGLPEQGLADWRQQLAQAVALAPPHLSIYDLIIEPGTVFAWRQGRGELALPDADLGADLMDLTAEVLQAAGYGHYEISNFALPGHASRHNRVYWSGAGWWGFGLGATSAPWGQRLARPRTRAAYAHWLAQGQQGARGSEATDLEAMDLEAMDSNAMGPAAFDPASIGAKALPGAEASPGEGAEPGAGLSPGPGLPFDERLLVGLRRREGVRLAELAWQAGVTSTELEKLLGRWQPYCERGLLLQEGPRWRLSDPEGLALSNGVLRELVAWWEERRAVD